MNQDAYDKAARLFISEKDVAELRKLLDPAYRPESMVIMVRSHFGYDVQVDGQDLGMDLAWNKARDIAELIGSNRPQTDRAGHSKKDSDVPG